MLETIQDPTVATALIGAIGGAIVTGAGGFWAWAKEREKARVAIEAAAGDQARAIHSDVAVAVQQALAVYKATLDHTSRQITELRDEIENLNAHIQSLMDALQDHGIQPPPKPPRRRRSVSTSEDMEEEG